VLASPTFRAYKRLKTEASVRERELESREQADQKERRAKKHEPIYVVLRIPDCNAIAVKSEPKNAKVQVNCCKQRISVVAKVVLPPIVDPDEHPGICRQHFVGRVF
jgi:hypothetical protein